MSIAFLLCSPFRVLAQSNQTDSLARLFEKNQDANLGLELAESFLPSSPDSAIYYIERLDFSLLSKEQKTQYLIFKGDLFQSLLKLDSAVKYFVQALESLEKTPLPTSEADVNDKIGLAYLDLRDSVQAFNYFNQAIEIRKDNNLNEELSKSYYALGNIRFKQGNPKSAISNYKKSIKVIDGENDISLLANLNYMIGNSYSILTKVDSALYYFKEAKALYDKIGPDKMKVAVSNELAQVLLLEKKYDKAILILEQNLETIALFNDWQYYNRTYSLLVQANEGTGNYIKALS
ncbi:MAG: two-component system NarL family sensor kinase, partial [Nonlabens sp.]